MLVLNCVLLVAVIALTVYVVASQDWPRLIFSAFLFVMVLSNLSVNQRTLRFLRRAQSGESTSAPEHHA